MSLHSSYSSLISTNPIHILTPWNFILCTKLNIKFKKISCDAPLHSDSPPISKYRLRNGNFCFKQNGTRAVERF